MQMTTTLPASVPLISGDRDRLMQAVINLISNAVKFCDPGTGRIHVALSQDRLALNVSVSDNGVGIHPDDQAAIFEQFRQITSATGRGRPQGSGLGLAITKRIIDHHHGQIRVESALGRGATFHITLPRLTSD
jgi:signal transduction histidine kinase